jgi:hypothetical protein
VDSVPDHFDAFASAPTSSTKTLSPYTEKYRSRSPGALDISDFFSRNGNVSSTSGATLDERWRAVTFEPATDLEQILQCF